MKFLVTLLLLPWSALAFFQQPTQSLSLLQAGYAGAANYADGQNSLVVGKTDTSSGDYLAQPVSPADFFKGIVFGIDTNSFTVINGTLYGKATAGGGSYPAIMTNYDASTFAATNFIYLGNVPSFYGWAHSGYTNATINIGMAVGAVVVASADGGATWTANATNVPCVIALTNLVGATDNATNVTVLAYVNPAAIGATNDRTDQVEFVAPAVDPKSPVTLSQMQAGDASAAANWATFPASSDVDLSGRGLKFGGTWKVWTSNRVMIATANLVDVWTVTPGISTNGNAPILVSLTAGGYYTFEVSADSTPTIYYSKTLPNTNSWPVLPSQTNSFSGGYWYVTAPILTNAAPYFRAAIAGTNATAAVLNFNGGIKAQSFTGSMNASNVTGVVPTTVSISPSSVTNDGTQFPAGTVTSGTTNLAGALIATNAASQRFYSFNGGSLTNLPLSGISTNGGTVGMIPTVTSTGLVYTARNDQPASSALTNLANRNGGELTNLNYSALTNTFWMPLIALTSSGQGQAYGTNSFFTFGTFANGSLSTGSRLAEVIPSGWYREADFSVSHGTGLLNGQTATAYLYTNGAVCSASAVTCVTTNISNTSVNNHVVFTPPIFIPTNTLGYIGVIMSTNQTVYGFSLIYKFTPAP